MNKLYIVINIFLATSFVIADTSKMKITENMYKVKIFKGKWKMYEGVKKCKFERNKDLTIIKFGGVGRYDYKAELEVLK